MNNLSVEAPVPLTACRDGSDQVEPPGIEQKASKLVTEPETNSQTKNQTDRQTADQLRLAITRTARRLRQEAGGGLSPTVIATLASIERNKVVTPGELARIEGVQRPTMTRAIHRLAEAGLIERNQDPEDGRSSLISLSGEGHRYLVEHRSRKSAWLANLIEEMPQEDADTLARAAEILSSALESHRTGEFSLPAEGNNLSGGPVPDHREGS